MSVPAAERRGAGPPSVQIPDSGPAAPKRWGPLVLLSALPALLLFFAPAATILWVTSPSGEDLAAHVSALSAAGGGTVQPAEVPLVLEHAVVAAEDERFYVHHGLDTIGTARAILTDLTRLCACEGGSTLTQQLAKLVYYASDGRIARKLPSVAVAFKIELRYSKAQIMADYLSVVPTGYWLVTPAQPRAPTSATTYPRSRLPRRLSWRAWSRGPPSMTRGPTPGGPEPGVTMSSTGCSSSGTSPKRRPEPRRRLPCCRRAGAARSGLVPSS